MSTARAHARESRTKTGASSGFDRKGNQPTAVELILPPIAGATSFSAAITVSLYANLDFVHEVAVACFGAAGRARPPRTESTCNRNNLSQTFFRPVGGLQATFGRRSVVTARALPPSPNLDQLKRQAKELLRRQPQLGRLRDAQRV